MSKPRPTRYRTTNWSSYHGALRKRGSLLIWVDKDITWQARADGRPGRRSVSSDAAIQFCLSLKILFKLPLRQTEGRVASLLRLAGLLSSPSAPLPAKGNQAEVPNHKRGRFQGSQQAR